MWEVVLMIAACIFGIIWLLLPAEDKIRDFFNSKK
jgi:hypothetical protein